MINDTLNYLPATLKMLALFDWDLDKAILSGRNAKYLTDEQVSVMGELVALQYLIEKAHYQIKDVTAA